MRGWIKSSWTVYNSPKDGKLVASTCIGLYQSTILDRMEMADCDINQFKLPLEEGSFSYTKKQDKPVSQTHCTT